MFFDKLWNNLNGLTRIILVLVIIEFISISLRADEYVKVPKKDLIKIRNSVKRLQVYEIAYKHLLTAYHNVINSTPEISISTIEVKEDEDNHLFISGFVNIHLKLGSLNVKLKTKANYKIIRSIKLNEPKYDKYGILVVGDTYSKRLNIGADVNLIRTPMFNLYTGLLVNKDFNLSLYSRLGF